MEDSMETDRILFTFASLGPSTALRYIVSNLMKVCWVFNKHTAATYTEDLKHNTDLYISFYVKSLVSRTIISDRYAALSSISLHTSNGHGTSRGLWFIIHIFMNTFGYALHRLSISLATYKIIPNKLYQIFKEGQPWKNLFAWNRPLMRLTWRTFLQKQPGKTNSASEFVIFHLLLLCSSDSSALLNILNI